MTDHPPTHPSLSDDGKGDFVQDESENHHEKDLIIDEGFAVLNTFRVSKIQQSEREPDPIPRYPFASFHNVLQVDPKFLPLLKDECDLVFAARDVQDGEAYSTGITFFLPAVATPRCALEDLVSQIFKAHTADLIPGRHYDIERSGAEWWTLILETKDSSSTTTQQEFKTDPDEKHHPVDDDEDDEDDEIGMHFDADYGLEEQLPNYMLHPRIATITYLTDTGVPTLILNKKSPPPADLQKLSLDGNITKGWLSCPSIGKHTAFDGRFLHGAPAGFFPAARNSVKDDVQSSKRRKVHDNETSYPVPGTTVTKRVTLLVNIWINHCPQDAEILDDDVCSMLTPVWSSEDPHPNPILWTLPDINTPDPVPTTTVAIAKSRAEEAGVESLILCNHNVVLHFRSSKKDLLSVVKDAKNTDTQSIEIDFEPGALFLEVGDELDDESVDEGNEVITIDS